MFDLRLKLLIITMFVSSILSAQYYNKTAYWNKRKHEASVYLGVANYLGELGGGDGEKRPWLLDMEFSQFKFSWGLSYRYNFNRYIGGRTMFAWNKVSGSDALTTNPERSYRNLSFKSDIYEFTVLADFFILRAKPGHIHNIRGAKGDVGSNLEVIGSVGIGGFYFRSTANGVPLYGLSTEGQGLEGGPKQYQPYSICIPFGASFTYRLTDQFKIGLEGLHRVTLTDYIDDASTVYYDNDKLREIKGDVSADLADPSDGSKPAQTDAGSPRGNPKNNDHYLSVMTTVTYTFLPRRPVYRPGGDHQFNRKKRWKKRMKF